MPSNSSLSSSEGANPLGITGESKASVPVFVCLVYVRHNDDSTVDGRVANLEGIEATGSSERDVLSKVVREFKSRITKMREDDVEIPLVDPPLPPRENERVRSVPVHL